MNTVCRTKDMTFALFFLNRILEVARCSQLTDVGFTTLARVSIFSKFYRFCLGFLFQKNEQGGKCGMAAELKVRDVGNFSMAGTPGRPCASATGLSEDPHWLT